MFHASSSDSARTNNEFFHINCFSNPVDAIAANIRAAFLSLVFVLTRAAATFGVTISTLPLDVCDLGTLEADGPVSMLSSDESDDSDELHRTSSSNSAHGDSGIVVTAGVVEHIFNAYFSAPIFRFTVRCSIKASALSTPPIFPLRPFSR